MAFTPRQGETPLLTSRGAVDQRAQDGSAKLLTVLQIQTTVAIRGVFAAVPHGLMAGVGMEFQIWIFVFRSLNGRFLSFCLGSGRQKEWHEISEKW